VYHDDCNICENFVKAGVSVASAKSVLSGRGSLAAVNSAFAKITYHPAQDVHSALTDFDTLSFSLWDTADMADDSSATSLSSFNSLVDISPSNDAPVVTAPSKVSCVEDVEHRLTSVSVSDVDLSTNYYSMLPLTVTLEVAQGTLGLYSTAGLTFEDGSTSVAHAHSKLTVTGDQGAINRALNPLSYMPSADWNSFADASSFNAEVQTISITSDPALERQRVVIIPGAGGAGALAGKFTLKMSCKEFADQINFVGYASGTNLNSYTQPLMAAVSVSSHEWEAPPMEIGNGTHVELELNKMIDECTRQAQEAADDYISSTAGTVASYDLTTERIRAEVVMLPNNPDDLNVYNSFEVTFVNSFASFPLLTVSSDHNVTTANGVRASVTVEQVATGVNVIGGSYTLSNNDVMQTLTADASEEEMEVAIVALMGAASSNIPHEVSVSRTVTDTESKAVTYSVTFSNYLGDMEELVVASKSDMTGAGVDVVVSEIVAGAADHDTLTITLSDNGNFGSGSALTTVETVEVFVSPTNDPPVVTVPEFVTSLEEDVSLKMANLVGVADVDDSTLTVSISCLRGGVTYDETGVTSSTHISVVEAVVSSEISGAFSTLKLSGSTAQLTHHLNLMVFTPNPDFNGITDISVEATDAKGNTGVGTVRLSVVAVNDDPTVVTPGAILASSGSPATIGGISFADVDIADEWHGLLTVSLSASSGSLTIEDPNRKYLTQFTDGDGVADRTMAFTGSPEMINLALAKLVYTSDVGFVGSDTVSVTVSDGAGATASAGILLSVLGASAGLEVNVPNSFIYGEPIEVIEDGIWKALAEEEMLSLGNADGLLDAGAPLTVTVASNHGAISLEADVFSSETTFSEVLSEVNIILGGLVYAPGENFNGVDVVTVSAAQSSGGSTTVMKILFLTKPVNDAPTLTYDDAEVQVEEGKSVIVGGWTLADVDAEECAGDSRCSGGGLVQVKITTSGYGSASIASIYNSIPSIVLHSCDGADQGSSSGRVCFQSKVAAANSALSALTYSANYNSFTEGHSVSIEVDDLGNWDGGLGQRETVQVTVPVTVIEAPVVPHFTLASTYIETTEDTPAIIYPTLNTDSSMASLTVTVSSKSSGIFKLTDEGLSGVEIFYSSGAISVTGSASVLSSSFHGDISKTSRVGFVYTPASNFNGMDALTFSTGGDGSLDVSADVKIFPVNDAPVLSLAAGYSDLTLTVDEGESHVLSLVDVDDVDSSENFGGTIQVDVYVSSGSGKVISSSSFVVPGVWASDRSDGAGVTLKGGVDALSSALTGKFLSFVSPANYYGSSVVTYEVDDLGNSGTPGALTDSVSVPITINQVHNPPTIVFSAPRATVSEDIQAALNVGVTVTAPELDSLVNGNAMFCELKVTYGALVQYSDENTVWSEMSNTNTLSSGYTYRVDGASSHVSSKLSSLIYQPSSNFNGLDVMTLVCSDHTVVSEEATLNIVVTSVNDGPSVILPVVSFQFNEDEDVALGAGVGAFVVDPDAHELSGGMVTLEVDLSTDACSLTFPSSSSLAGVKTGESSSGSGGISLEGNVANVNAAVSGVVLSCEKDWSGTGSLSFDVVDGQSDSSGDHVATFTVVEVNDAPVLSTSFAILSVIEDQVYGLEDFMSIVDVDAAEDEKISVTLIVEDAVGGFMINSDGDANLIALHHLDVNYASSVVLIDAAQVGGYGNDVFSTLVVAGKLADLNNFIKSPAAFFFVPSFDYFGTDKSFTAVLVDAMGGQSSTAHGLIVSGVNDAPTIVLNNNNIVATEDVALSLAGAFSVGDVDMAHMPDSHQDASLSVSISAGAGTVGLATTVPGCYITSSDGWSQSNHISFRASLEVIEKTLEQLVYTGCADCDVGDVLTVAVGDSGTFGTGGALDAVMKIPIAIAAVNDAPRATQPTKFINEGSADSFDLLKVSFEDFNVYDVDEDVNDLVKFTMTVIPTGAGTIDLVDLELAMSSGGISFTSGDGIADEAVSFETSTAIAKVLFSRVLFNGSPSATSATIIVTAEDKEGAVLTENIALSSLVKGQNNAPAISFGAVADGDVSVLEGDFHAIDFLSVDDIDVGNTPNAFLEVTASTSTGGSLEVQTVTTSVPHMYPIWTIRTSAASGTLGGSFILDVNGQQTGAIYADALSKAEYEIAGDATDGHGSGQSVESVLNSLTVLSNLGVKVEVFRDGASAGSVNNGGVSANQKLGEHADAQGGHVWRVTFLNAGYNAITMSVHDDSGLTAGGSPAVAVAEAKAANYLEGTFTLGLGSTYVSSPIPFSASSQHMADALQSMESVESVKVTRSDNDVNVGSYVWSVTFLSMGEGLAGGDVPQLELKDNSLGDSSESYPHLFCGVDIATVADGYGAPTIWRIDSMAHSSVKPLHSLKLEGDTISGYFTVTLPGFGTTGPIFKDTVARTTDETASAGRDGSLPDGMNAGESIESLISSLPNWDSDKMSVHVSRSASTAGSVLKIEWLITYTGVDHVSSSVITTNNAGTCSASASFLLSTNLDRAGNYLGGDWKVSWGEQGKVGGSGVWTTSDALSFAATEDDVKTQLVKVMGGASSVELEVARTGPDNFNGYSWTVALLRGPSKFYTSSENSGGAGVMIVDGSGLTGQAAAAQAVLLREGGVDAKLALSSRALGGVYFPLSERRGTLVDGLSSSNSLTMRGSLSSINSALSFLTVQTPKDFFGDLYLEVTVDDHGFSGNGGAKSDSQVLKMLVAGVNDDPIVSYNGVQLESDDTVISGFEDSEFRFADQDFSLPVFQVSDPDVGVGDLIVKVVAGNGEVAIGAASGGAGVGVTISGPLSVINTELKGLSYMPDWNWWGEDYLEFVVSSESGASSSTRRVILDVRPVNDFPTIVIEGEGTLATQLMTDPRSWDEVVKVTKEDVAFAIDFVSVYDTDNMDVYKELDGVAESPGASASSGVQQLIEVELSVRNGTLSVSDSDAQGVYVTKGSDSRSLVLRGLQSNLNSCLKKVTYLGEANWYGADRLTVEANDFGIYTASTSSEAMALTHVRHVVIQVDPVNDIPFVVLPLGEGGVLKALEDVGGIIGSPCSGVGMTCDSSHLNLDLVSGVPVHYLHNESFHVQDDDAGEDGLVTLSIELRYGSLTLSDLSDVSEWLTFSEGTGVVDRKIVATGKVKYLNQALDGAVYLSDKNYNSEYGHVFPVPGYDNGMEMITFTVTDSSGGSSESVQVIDVHATNDAPVVTTGLDVNDSVLYFEDGGSSLRVGVNTLNVREDIPFSVPGVVVRDVDCEQTLMEGMVQVSAYASNGTVSIAENSPVQQYVVGSGGVENNLLVVKGAVKNINAALATLVYQGNADFYGSDSLIIEVSDLGNNGYSFEFDGSSNTTTLRRDTVAKVNTVVLPIAVKSEVDAPVIIVPDFPTTKEDTPKEMVGVAISDVDGGSGLHEISINCNNGRIKLDPLLTGLTFSSGDGMLDDYLNFTGSLADINIAIQNFTYVPKHHWHTSGRELDEIVITINDMGLMDPEKDAGISSKTLFVEVLPVNDAPEIRVPGIVWTLPALSGGFVVDYVETSYIDEDMELVFETNVQITDWDLQEEDVSSVDSVMELEVKCGHCTLKFSEGFGGLLWLDGSNNGDKRLKVRGALKNLNTALAGMVYTGLQDFNGNDDIELLVDDLGNYGEGGNLHHNITIPVFVNAINDSPKWDVPNFPAVCAEDYQCKISNVMIKDPDSTEYTGVFEVLISVDFGVVNLNGLEVPSSIKFLEQDGEGDGTVRLTGSMEDINFMLKDLVYTPPEDYTTLSGRGNDVIHLAVVNDGGSPLLTAVGRVMVVVAEGNNDAPIVKYDFAHYVKEDNCESEDVDYSVDSNLLLGGNQSTAPAFKQCSRLVSVDILNCVEDEVCALTGLTVEDADAVEVDYHVIEVTLSATNGNLVLEKATSFDLWWGEGSGGAWPKDGEAVEVSVAQHKVIMRGRLDVVNEGLESLTYVGDPHFYGADSILVEVDDLGFWGAGGSKRAVMSIPVVVSAVEDKAEVALQVGLASGAVEAVEDVLFVVGGVSFVHADSDAAGAIAHKAGAAGKAAGFDGLNVPQTPGAGFIRAMVEGEGLKWRLSSDKGLLFTVPSVEDEEVRRYAGDGYEGKGPFNVEALDGAEGLDFGLRSGAPEIVWWKNVTVEGRLADVNAAFKNLNVLGDSNFEGLGSLSFSVKSLGVAGDGSINSADEVVNWHWEWDDSRTVYVRVAGQNDLPVIGITGLESYEHEKAEMLTGDGLSRVVTAIQGLEAREEELLSVPFSVRDVDDEELRVVVTATRGLVSLTGAVDGGLYFLVGDGSYDQTFTVTGTVENLNKVFETLTFIGEKDYFGSGGSVTFVVYDDGDGNANVNGVKSVVRIEILPVNDAVELTMALDKEDYGMTYFVDEGEGVRLGGAVLHPDKFEYLNIGIRGEAEYASKTGYELWRTEGEKPWLDNDGDFARRNATVGWGNLEKELWRGNLVKDVHDGVGSSEPRYFEEYNGLLYFSAGNGVDGRELWRTDGEKIGTALVKDIFPGARGSDPRWLTSHGGYLYFSADGVDDTWMIKDHLSDECGGFRQSSMNSKVYFAVSASNTWDVNKDYDCPWGYHWASTKEAEELFTSEIDHSGVVGEERTYSNECGWSGYDWAGVTRRMFRYSDSRITGAYKLALHYDSVRSQKDGTTDLPSLGELTTSDFAGIVCVAGEPQGGEGAAKYYDECRFEHNSNGGLDYDSVMDSGCWARGGRELWRTDGSQEGTVRVIDSRGGGGNLNVQSGMRGSDPRYLLR